jgi:uncharacterized protein YndB with AHSA1/START domain
VAQVSLTADREILVSRVFDAPRELVYKVWTDKQRVAERFGPRGWPHPVFVNKDFNVIGAE